MSIQSIAFRTRARTIDHLGREQIADCPTAVSELWKNSYDAYARRVELNIFDGLVPVAVLADDGHGMNKDEFIEKWLVVGTDSKISGSETSENDRDGLLPRPKQGQKGIGRLSSANLGSLLLLVSKRRNHPFSAALIDWRIFENPFLMLHDIRIPVIEFHLKEELLERLAPMFDTLMSNIWGTGKPDDQERDGRITLAWENLEAFDKVERKPSTKSSIENTIIHANFEERHFSCWDVWAGSADKGTALFIANISDDLLSQLSQDSKGNKENSIVRSQARLFETLSNFTDPFVRGNEPFAKKDFSTAVIVWNGLLRRPILDEERVFRIENLDNLEHVVEGYCDEAGTFHGRIKVFGQWNEKEITIKPTELIKTRADTVCGPFHIRLGTFEGNLRDSTLSDEQHSFFQENAELYSGFMVYRDGLRVMPYGREDNDYFEIEKRRTQHAGRNFWSNRNLFGRVAISRQENQNLKDKAGREGLIDNKASKIFRYLVENVLTQTGKKYFGTDSQNRKDLLPDIQAQRDKERAEIDRKKITKKQRNEFKKKLIANASGLNDIFTQVKELSQRLTLLNDEQATDEIHRYKEQASNLTDWLKDFSLSPIPAHLGTLEGDYKAYRRKEKEALALLSETSASINLALEKLFPKSPAEIASNQLQRSAAQLHSRIRKWAIEGRSLLAEEITRFNGLVEERNKAFHAVAYPLIEDIEHGRIELAKGLNFLEEEYHKQHQKNVELFPPYLAALQSMREQIDLESLVTHTLAESVKLREEVERLHALAQLGITVEIIGHEIEGLDMTIARGLKSLPESVKETTSFKAIQTAQNALSDRWRFLSPLKLSGERLKTDITGKSIFEYVHRFFEEAFLRSGTHLEASQAFLDFQINEQPARIYPVFINLVNNSHYWTGQNPSGSRRILFDVVDKQILVADDGPGVDEDDLEHLFTLFFTRKQRGGRGIGLYLCRTNLFAGGHSIKYETDGRNKRLSGANFIIGFKGARNV